MKNIKKIICIVLICAICISFSSCDLTIQSVEALMRPPKLSGENSLLQDAFESYVKNSKDVIMKTPISGDNRSTYLYFDLDNDKVNEAFVFYSDPTVDEFAKVGIFKKNNNKWELVSDIKGLAEEVYAVNFADINGDNKYEIVFGWTSIADNEGSSGSVFGSSSERTLTVYGYNNSTTNLLITETFSKMYVGDFNADNSDEFLLVNIDLANTDNRTSCRILSYNDDYSSKDDIALQLSGMIEVLNIVTDKILIDDSMHTRVYIDGSITETAVITEVIDIEHESYEISLPLYENNTSEKPVTIRDNRTYSTDIDNDGIIEIPTLETLKGGKRITDGIEGFSSLNLTVWSELNDEYIIEPEFKSLLNTTHGYMYVFPEEWTDEITAVYNNTSALLTFYVLNENETIGAELFSILPFSELKWNDNHSGYSKIMSVGALIYGYSLTPNSYVTKEDIINNFMIID